MKHTLFFILLTLPLALLSCDDYEKPPKYETIVGNTYICSEMGTRHIYTFNVDGTIDVEVRTISLDYGLESKGKGTYEYKHPILKLSGSIRCENCINNYEAIVSKDRREFTITKWNEHLKVNYEYDVYDDYYSEY